MTLFALARQARERNRETVWLRSDGRVRLQVGPDELEGATLPKVQPDCLHLHPHREQSVEEAAGWLASVRSEYPGGIHGLSPGYLTRHGRDCLEQFRRAGLTSFCLYSGSLDKVDPAAQGWMECRDLEIPKTACLVYSPRDSWSALEERLGLLAEARQLQSVVCLPAACGDYVVVPGATTEGTRDIEMLVRARLRLDPAVRVRAAWGALGFKLAQASLCFGSDELAGWGLEEFLTYGRRGRPVSVVDADEARAGIVEACREPVEEVPCASAS